MNTGGRNIRHTNLSKFPAMRPNGDPALGGKFNPTLAPPIGAHRCSTLFSATITHVRSSK
jgi:hypothetical protein